MEVACMECALNYQKVLSLVDDKVIIIDAEVAKVVWASKQVSKIYPQIIKEATIKDVLEVLAPTLEIRKNIKKLIGSERIVLSKRKNIRCGIYELEINKLDRTKTFIRLNEIRLEKEAFSRHLEDRQQLLFASRSFSISEMASTIAHEINQPIGALANLLEGIKDRLKLKENDDKSIIWAIEKSIEQTKYTSQVINRIREYAQTKKPRLSKLDIIALINKCISLMDWEILKTNLTINNHVNTDSAIVLGDELMLQLVIVNLIRNGIEAISEKDKIIEISTKHEGGYLEILIKDNGRGLSEEEEENIFIPFASNKATGMGIGLNICRSFIELHSGRIWLTRNADRGCTSHILLPVNCEAST